MQFTASRASTFIINILSIWITINNFKISFLSNNLFIIKDIAPLSNQLQLYYLLSKSFYL